MADSDFSLYILRCADGSLYTGISTDVSRRIQEHQDGTRGAKFLRGKGPLRLEFEQCVGSRGIASRIEYRVKQLGKSRKEQIISGESSLSELMAEPGANSPQASGEACG